MLKRITELAVMVAVAGMAALGAMALKFPFFAVFACICVGTLAGFFLIGLHQRQRQLLEQSGSALGQFMRGHWHARISPEASDDAFSQLQYRINNMLDVIDLHLRGQEAAIDRKSHAEYIEKLRFTALSEALSNQSAERSDRSASGSVGALLQQLGHDVAGLLVPERESAAPGQAAKDEDWRETLETQQEQQVSQMRATLQRLQVTTELMAQRAIRPAVRTEVPKLSVATLDKLMAKIAEQSTVIALNIAIAAERAPSGSTLPELAEELQAVATQLHKARADMASLLASAVPKAEPVVSVPLSLVVEALAGAENSLRAHLSAAEALQRQLRGEEPASLEEAA